MEVVGSLKMQFIHKVLQKLKLSSKFQRIHFKKGQIFASSH